MFTVRHSGVSAASADYVRGLWGLLPFSWVMWHALGGRGIVRRG